MFWAWLGQSAESRDAHPVAAHPPFCANAECAAMTDDEKLAEKYRHLAERLSRAFTALPIVGDERHRYVNALLAIAKFFEGLGPFDTYARNL